VILADDRGKLLPIRFSDLPFEPKEIFVVYDVPAGTIRARHAHFENEQMLVCVSGEIRVKLENKIGEREVILNAGESVLHGSMEWAEITFLTGRDMLISICSKTHCEDDYIRDYAYFRRLL